MEVFVVPFCVVYSIKCLKTIKYWLATYIIIIIQKGNEPNKNKSNRLMQEQFGKGGGWPTTKLQLSHGFPVIPKKKKIAVV